MAFWNRWFSRKSDGSVYEAWLRLLGDQTKSKSGKSVNTATALQNDVVIGCTRSLSDGVAQPPLKLFRSTGDSRVEARDHPLFDVLHRRPNPWQTSFEYRETLMWHAVLCRGHFSFINRVAGKIVELIPFQPHQVTVKRNEGTYELTYEVTGPSGARQVFPAESIWHVRGPSWDSWNGIDIVKQARESIGLAIAIEEQQAEFYKNGARPTAAVSLNEGVGVEKYKALREWIERELSTAQGQWRPIILDHGAKWQSLDTTGVDAQTLEQRNHQLGSICRVLKVMPIMIGYSDKAATYASAEQMFLQHIVHTLSPWYERLEQSIDANLLTDKDRAEGIYAKFIEEGLLRGSMKDTADYLLKMVNGGLMYPNEARAKLDLNPDPDPASNKLRVPANIVGEPPKPKSDDDAPDPAEA